MLETSRFCDQLWSPLLNQMSKLKISTITAMPVLIFGRVAASDVKSELKVKCKRSAKFSVAFWIVVGFLNGQSFPKDCHCRNVVGKSSFSLIPTCIGV